MALSVPDPRADHAEPFQRAMRLAGAPPAVVKRPPATRSPPDSAARALTELFTPEPKADHWPVARSNAAMLVIRFPAAVKEPPSTRRAGAGPAPSGSHMVAARGSAFVPARCRRGASARTGPGQ